MCSNLRRVAILLAFVVLGLPGENNAAKNGKPGVADIGGAKAVLWSDPADIASRNLLYGSGGEGRQPRGPFTFIEEDTEGSNPKLDIRDIDGVKWKVKLGAEARPEVAASRLVWAAGYFTTDDYFLEELRVQDLPGRLHRGQELVGPDGTLHNVRLKRPMKDQEKLGTWHWASNPFQGTREFNGLRVLMALMNNWDLKDSNNAVYQAKNHDEAGERPRIYLVSDLGATFGTTGYIRSLEASRGNLDSYKQSKFISNLNSDFVDFGAPGRPTLLETVNLPVFLHRLDLRSIGRRIPREDAKWIGQLLGRLSQEQIRDAFRAAGYSSVETNEFARVVESRIAELNAL